MLISTNNQPLKSPIILDTTLRDGSYVLDFQFTTEDTFQIAQKLDNLGFEYIEVGHGTGLGSSEKNLGKAAATDEEYIHATKKAVLNGKWGMFCIPGICELSNLKMAIDNGMNFVRVGTEVNGVEKGKPFIELAKKSGLLVCCNLMKSYTSNPTNFAIQATKCIDMGADVIYIVDSAGGMLPNELLLYIEALRSINRNFLIGFHGHNNLGMAVANSLFCAYQGVDIIDTTLQGLGRSAGNTPTSEFIAVLMRSGFDSHFNLVDLMLVSEHYVRHFVQNIGIDTIDVTCGFAQFHSGFLPQVKQAAEMNDIDIRDVIIELSKLDKEHAHQELIEQAIANFKSQYKAH